MGMYTEFYFRANVKDGEVADWLDANINGDSDDWFETPFDDHPFFDAGRYWRFSFCSGGAVYQESRLPVFRRKGSGDVGNRAYSNQLVLACSVKGGSPLLDFIDWIAPHLDMAAGDFLGYSLYEDSRPSGWGSDTGPDQERPVLHFMPKLPKAAS